MVFSWVDMKTFGVHKIEFILSSDIDHDLVCGFPYFSLMMIVITTSKDVYLVIFRTCCVATSTLQFVVIALILHFHPVTAVITAIDKLRNIFIGFIAHAANQVNLVVAIGLSGILLWWWHPAVNGYII